MTLEAIKEAIERLQEPEYHELFDWLEERIETSWDAKMEHDFSPAGRGAHLVEKTMADVAEGMFQPIQT